MILDKLRRKKKPKPPKLSRTEFLSLKPIRNPILTWQKDEKGEIEITVPLKKIREEAKKRKVARSRTSRFFSRFFQEPEEKKIRLDEVGSMVWELCDGQTTTKEIIDHLCEKYKLLPREVEISLGTYLNSLVKRGLIAFIVPEDLRERLAKQSEEKQKS